MSIEYALLCIAGIIIGYLGMEWYKKRRMKRRALKKIKNQPQEQISELANFLMKYYPHEMGKAGSEGAVEMAIRLLTSTIPPKEK